MYHKLRFFWGPIALASVVVVGRRVFRIDVGLAGSRPSPSSRRHVLDALARRGQLAPYSHASDVAMGVLLPVTLAFVVSFLDADRDEEARFLFVGAVGLVLMLSIVHIREVVQVLVYLGVYLLYLLWTRTERRQLARTAVLLATTVVIAGAFTSWQEHIVTHVGSVEQRTPSWCGRSARRRCRMLQPPAAGVL